MGDDLISRQVAIDALEKKKDKKAKGDIGGFYNKIIQNDIDTLMLLPSAQPKRGEWVAVDSYSAFGGDESAWVAHGNPTAYHYCSNCKEQTYVDEFGKEILSDFCPNCGARMKGADDE